MFLHVRPANQHTTRDVCGLLSSKGWTHSLDTASQTLFRGGTPNIIIHIPKNPCLQKQKKIIERQLLAHGDYSSISNCQKKILAIFRCIFIILLRYFKTVIYLFHYFSRNPQMVFCGTVRFRGTQFEKHCP